MHQHALRAEVEDQELSPASNAGQDPSREITGGRIEGLEPCYSQRSCALERRSPKELVEPLGERLHLRHLGHNAPSLEPCWSCGWQETRTLTLWGAGVRWMRPM